MDISESEISSAQATSLKVKRELSLGYGVQFAGSI